MISAISSGASGRDRVGTMGAGGAWTSSMVASLAESSSTRGSELKISYGETVRCTLNDNGKVSRKGVRRGDWGRKLGEDRESGDANWPQGESGGVVAGSE